MTKLFGAVVGAISFFKTRPVDKAKVNQNKVRIDSDFVLLLWHFKWRLHGKLWLTQIDNSVFRLHYDFTVGFFFLATALLRFLFKLRGRLISQLALVAAASMSCWGTRSCVVVWKTEKSTMPPKLSHNSAGCQECIQVNNFMQTIKRYLNYVVVLLNNKEQN